MRNDSSSTFPGQHKAQVYLTVKPYLYKHTHQKMKGKCLIIQDSYGYMWHI